jgi:hypothetical protein
MIENTHFNSIHLLKKKERVYYLALYISDGAAIILSMLYKIRLVSPIINHYNPKYKVIMNYLTS